MKAACERIKRIRDQPCFDCTAWFLSIKAGSAGVFPCYWDTPDGRVFGLRSNDEGVDVSAVAKQYGGDLSEAKRKRAELECRPAPVETGIMRVVFDRYARGAIPGEAPKTK